MQLGLPWVTNPKNGWMTNWVMADSAGEATAPEDSQMLLQLGSFAEGVQAPGTAGPPAEMGSAVKQGLGIQDSE